jgi:hypothetical protein
MIEDSKRAEPRFKGMAHGVRTIIAEEGYRGIYRGLGPVVGLWYTLIADVRCYDKVQILQFDSRRIQRSSRRFKGVYRQALSFLDGSRLGSVQQLESSQFVGQCA